MKMNFIDIGKESKLVLFSNGKETVDYFRNTLNDIKDVKAPV